MNREQNRFENKDSGLYVHVPFCFKKCLYCDFYSETDLSLIPRWLEAFELECKRFQGRFSTLYIGGGTPSALASDQLIKLFDLIKENFELNGGLENEIEITIEANPEDLDADKISLFKSLPVNRVSLGVQSFFDDDLALMNRRHNADRAENALKLLSKEDSLKVSVDIIFAVPGQDRKRLEDNLEKVISYHPSHISCYQLTEEKGTGLHKKIGQGLITLPGEERSAELFLAVSEKLIKAGYEHYEISNFSLGPDNYSRHNSKYWERIPYLGLGPSAHSFNDGVRWWNVSDLSQYISLLNQGKSPKADEETLTPDQVLLERIQLGLRTAKGIEKGFLEDVPDIEQKISLLKKQGFVKESKGRLLPTKKGFLMADQLPLMLLG